jgi:hypothetical protein
MAAKGGSGDCKPLIQFVFDRLDIFAMQPYQPNAAAYVFSKNENIDSEDRGISTHLDIYPLVYSVHTFTPARGSTNGYSPANCPLRAERGSYRRTPRLAYRSSPPMPARFSSLAPKSTSGSIAWSAT